MSAPNSLPKQVIEAVATHGLRAGQFDQFLQHEPKSAPGTGVSAAVWLNSLRPASSGLVSTSVRMELTVRIYVNMLMEPQDEIDPVMMSATWDLVTAYSGPGFTLGGLVQKVDLLGEDGDPLQVEFGFVAIDRTMYRIADILLPVKINDAFDQAV
jgi:hypothetical protein